MFSTFDIILRVIASESLGGYTLLTLRKCMLFREFSLHFAYNLRFMHFLKITILDITTQ